jgi:hypothetical protein
MNSVKNGSRILGIAFLLQFVSSVISGLVLKDALIAPGDIVETMANIADKPWLMKTFILTDMVTSVGVIFLGVMLYVTLKKVNEAVALVGLGFYILEAALLAASRLSAFRLLRVSEGYVAAGKPAYMQTMGSLAAESMEFVGLSLHVLVFGLGAILFYYLLYQSRLIPRALSLWGLITVIPVFLATAAAIFGYELPAVSYLLYFPFEFVVGIWILFKGLSIQQEASVTLEYA